MKTKNALNLWYKTLKTTLKIPGAVLDRELFLQNELRKFCTPEQIEAAIAHSPQSAGVPDALINKIAKRISRLETTETGSLSFAAGLPGGFLLAASVPADMLQIHLHELMLMQKLAYLYGRPQIVDKDSPNNEQNLLYLTLLFGIMYGSEDAEDALDEFERENTVLDFSKQFEQAAVTRVSVQIAKWLGVRIAKGLARSGGAKVVPFLGGIISGGLSVVAMQKAGKRLREYLHESNTKELLA